MTSLDGKLWRALFGQGRTTKLSIRIIVARTHETSNQCLSMSWFLVHGWVICWYSM
jgi:hypothetical protein